LEACEWEKAMWKKIGSKSEKKLTSNKRKKALHASMVLSALFGSNQFISDNTHSLTLSQFSCVKVKIEKQCFVAHDMMCMSHALTTIQPLSPFYSPTTIPI